MTSNQVNPHEHPWSEEDIQNFQLWVKQLGGQAVLVDMDMKSSALFNVSPPEGWTGVSLVQHFDVLRFEHRKGIAH